MLMLFAVGVFAAVVMALEGLYYAFRMWSRPGRKATHFSKRVEEWSSEDGKIDESISILREVSPVTPWPWLNQWIIRGILLQKFERMRRLAGVEGSLAHYLIYSLGLGFACGLAAARAGFHFFLCLLAAGTAAGIPWIWLYQKKIQRQQLFDRQFPEVLELLARSLRSGHTLFIGLRLVAEEFEAPVGPEFNQVFDEVSMGIPINQAFDSFSQRVESTDVQYLISAINIQRETGGNLVEIMDSLAWVIRQRFKLKQKVKALAAEGQISAVVLSCLPFFLAVLLSIISPHYLDVFIKDPTGHMMLVVAIVMLVGGILVMQRMTKAIKL